MTPEVQSSVDRAASKYNLFVAVVYIAMGAFAGGGLILGPDKWRSGKSFDLIRHTDVPWALWGALFLLYASALVWRRSRTVGFALGASLYLFFGVSYAATIFTGQLANVVLLAGFLGTVAHQAVCSRYAALATEFQDAPV